MTDAPSSPDDAALFAAFPPVSDAAWSRAIREDLSERFKERLTWHATDGVDVYAYYRSGDLPAPDALSPLTKSQTQTADSAKSDGAGSAWRISQPVAHPDLGTARRHAREALGSGATDLTLVAASEQPRSLSLRNPRDAERLLEDVDLSKTALHLDAGTAAPELLDAVLAAADRRGTSPSALSGTALYDPAAILARQGRLSPDAYDRMANRLGTPLRLLAADARPYHEAGASVADEMAYALAALSEHLAQLSERGYALQRVAEALHVVLPVGTSFLLEVSKLRALRLLCPQVVAAYTGAEDPPAAFLHAVTSRREATRYAPYTNLLRATTEAAAAAMGGCDVLTVLPHDAAARVPSDFSQRLTRGTQLVLQQEANLARVADPAAGSYYIETLTDKLARAAWARFQEIEGEGGLLMALQRGSVQARIARARAGREEALAGRERVLVGVNRYPHPDETALGEAAQPEHGDAESHTDTDAGEAAVPSEAALTAEPLPSYRTAAPFEQLRLRTERHTEASGQRPTVFLLPFGPKGMRSARVNFARNFFGCAGFAFAENAPGYDPPESGVEAAQQAGAALVVLCSTDSAYGDDGPALCRALKALVPEPLVVVAGRPDAEDALRAAGADGFIHSGQNMLDALASYQKRLGLSAS